MTNSTSRNYVYHGESLYSYFQLIRFGILVIVYNLKKREPSHLLEDTEDVDRERFNSLVFALFVAWDVLGTASSSFLGYFGSNFRRHLVDTN